MTPAEWNAILAKEQPWKVAYAAVERAVKAHLDLAEDTISTNELAEALYPPQFARGDGILARARLYKAFAALARHELQAYCTRGELTKSKRGVMIRPMRWHSPKEIVVKTCPHCGKEVS